MVTRKKDPSARLYRSVWLGWMLGACLWIPFCRGQEIRVMTYNIEGTVGAGAALDTPQSRAIARVVDFNKPDILLVNELRAEGSLWDAISALQNWVNAFIPHFGSWPGVTYYTHVSTQSDGRIRNAAVSRYPILTPTTYDDGLRGLLSFQVRLSNGRTIQVYLTHLACCTACSTRQAQAQFAANIISDWAVTNPAPYLIAGDWNEDQERPICTINAAYSPITTIRSAGLSENRLTDLSGSRSSWTTRDPAPYLPMRFDYMLPATGRLRPTGGYLFNSTAWHALSLLTGQHSIRWDDVRTASDHYPVLGLFSLGAGPQPPRQLVARPQSSNRVELVWVAGGGDHLGYRIERSLHVDAGFVTIAHIGPAATSFVDGIAPTASICYYRVVATNDTGVGMSAGIGVVTPAASDALLAAYNSPVVNSNRPWPNADDGTEAFDLEVSGGSLPGANGSLSGGFGSLAHLVFNHDDDFLYVGAQGVRRDGDNALLVLLDTKPGGELSLPERGRPYGIGWSRNVTFADGFRPDVALLLGGEYGDGGNYPEYSIGFRDYGQGVYLFSAEGVANLAGFAAAQGGSPISQFGTANNLSAEVKLSRDVLGLRDGRNAFKAAAMFVGGVSNACRYVSGRVYGSRVDGANDGGNFGFNPVRVSGAVVLLEKPSETTAAFERIAPMSEGTQLEWRARSNFTYTVQMANVLTSDLTGWTSALTTNNIEGRVVWTDSGQADLSAPATVLRRFYRLLISE